MPTTITTTTTYTTTERIVLLIDLSPLLHHSNHPNPYITAVISSATRLLTFPPLSHSLSSFKLIFSSLSPILSSSTLLNLNLAAAASSLSFNHPHQTLTSLSDTLAAVVHWISRLSVPVSVPKAVYTSSSIVQVIHDYPWDLPYDNHNIDCVVDEFDLLGVIRSNLVVLFSPICRSFNDLCQFFGNGDWMIDKIVDNDVFCGEFRRVFGCVRDGFMSRDIHFSWVDVRYKEDDYVDKERWKLGEEHERIFELFRIGVKGLGWGFCPTDFIVLGSALVPFGLIYPMIGVSSNICRGSGDRKGKKLAGQLCLEISDVSGKPLECKYCDLQLVNLKMSSGNNIGEIRLNDESSGVGVESGGQVSGIWEQFKDGVVKIDVKGLIRHNEIMEVEEQISGAVLVCDSVDMKRNKEGLSKDFFADRVLDLLCEGTGEALKRKSPPLWQILLSFLCRRGYSGLVSLSKADGSTIVGVLKPLTVDLAFLCILKNNADVQCGALGLKGLSLGNCSSGIRDNVGVDSAIVLNGNKSKRKQKQLQHLYKDMSCSSFCKAVLDGYKMELEEAYISTGYGSSKKLKFLKCWMKQIVESCLFLPGKSDVPNSQGKQQERVSELGQEREKSLQCLNGEDILKEPTETLEATPLPEAAEAFFSDLPGRIQHGVISGVDLVTFAKRIVHSCIYWLSRNLGPHINEESQTSIKESEGSCNNGPSVGDLIKILLLDPKDIARNLSSKASDPNKSDVSAEDKIRQYELQILFRMEILVLQSEIAFGIRETTRIKFVKQICSLLEFIQCSMEDGFFGDFNLSDYVGRIISARYNKNLGGVVHRIYEQMDLLLFDGEDDSPNLLLNSEDSNQSWKIGDHERGSDPNSTDDSFSGPSKDYEQTQKETGMAVQERKLVEAQERRDRASRLGSFSRRAMPDLQRVWAPKPPKLSRSKSESFRRQKRKSRRESYGVVCETPMTGTEKFLSPSEVIVPDQESREQEDSGTSSTKRALFQDAVFGDLNL